MEVGSWFDSWRGPGLQRRYIDLIYAASGRYVNWDAPMNIRVRPPFLSLPRIQLTLSMGMQVGAYGTVDKKTGGFHVEGNIYDTEFQRALDRQDIDLGMVDFPPDQGAIEDSLVIAANVSGNGDLNAEVTACVLVSFRMIVLACHAAGHIRTYLYAHDRTIPGILSAHFVGGWQSEHGKHGAVLVVHKPCLVYLPLDGGVLEKLHCVDKLVDKCLVASVQTCPAYSMYLSDKCAFVLFLMCPRYMY